MKNVNLFVLISFCLLALFTSCEEVCLEDCKNGGSCVEGSCDCPDGFSGDSCQNEDLCITQAPNCLNGGTCLNGGCDCPEGYSGDTCETHCSSTVVGTYNVTASINPSCQAGISTQISAGENSNEVRIIQTDKSATTPEYTGIVSNDCTTIGINPYPSTPGLLPLDTGYITINGNNIEATFVWGGYTCGYTATKQE